MNNNSDLAWADRLHLMGLCIQQHLVRSMRGGDQSTRSPDGSGSSFSDVVAEEGGDRIYAIDREVEPILERQIKSWPDECFPLQLIAEGLGKDGCQRFGAEDQSLRYRVIVDPIDGTRMLMYDKRSAWFLAAVVEEPQEDSLAGIADSIASVLVELPTTKQNLADSFVAIRSGTFNQSIKNATRVQCRRRDCSGSAAKDFEPDTSDTVDFEEIEFTCSLATNLTDGFVSVMNCFPGTRRLAADLIETIAERTGSVTTIPEFFDDQYISTGGQMVQLMTGKDRCCIDLRPLFNQIVGRTDDDRFLEAHPYDMAGWLAAKQAGVVMTDGFGNEFTAPLDVSTGVHWCGYANDAVRKIIEPVIQDWLKANNCIKPI
jgi:hypothetical protein